MMGLIQWQNIHSKINRQPIKVTKKNKIKQCPDLNRENKRRQLREGKTYFQIKTRNYVREAYYIRK